MTRVAEPVEVHRLAGPAAVTPDKSGRTTEMKFTNAAGTVLAGYDYNYQLAGVDTSLDQTRTDLVSGNKTTYAYDALSRVSAAVEKTSAGATVASWLYCYDKDGNRTGESTTTGGSCSSPSTTYTYNAADELTAKNGASSGLAYDGNGNETAGVGGPTALARTAETYNPSNAATSITANGTATGFSYDGLGNTDRYTAGATTSTNGILGVTATSTAGGTEFTREPNGALISQRVGTTSYYYLFDSEGSVLGQVDATGAKVSSYTYDPYGKTRTATGTTNNPYRYISGQYDTTTGLYKLGARYYDPTLGRFTQPDPSGQNPGYLYAGDNPITGADPGGLDFFSFGVSLKFGPVPFGVGLDVGSGGWKGFVQGGSVSTLEPTMLYFPRSLP